MPVPSGAGSGGAAAANMSGPCGDWEPPAEWCCTLTGSSAALTGTGLSAATEALFELSGQRFGLCEQTLRPCARTCADTGWPEFGSWPQPALIGGEWFNLVCGACGDNCSCTELSEALLPTPVYDITDVKVDGVTLAADAYRVDDHRILVRLDGESWPRCNDLTLDDSEVGTWSATVRFGEPVPFLGSIAVGELACEIAKLIACDSTCRLSPLFLSSLSRQGVSVEFVDPDDLFAHLPSVKMFLQTYNPNKLRGRARSYGLDSPSFRLAGT